MARLIAKVLPHRIELPRSHAGSRVLGRPSQAKNVSRQPTRRMTAASFEELDEAWQVYAGRGADKHVDVRPQNRHVDDLHILPGGSLVEVIVQERLGRLINHSQSLMRRPNQVNEELMCGHELECPLGQCWPSTPFRVLNTT